MLGLCLFAHGSITTDCIGKDKFLKMSCGVATKNIFGPLQIRLSSFCNGSNVVKGTFNSFK